jgi:hypothetical protein
MGSMPKITTSMQRLLGNHFAGKVGSMLEMVATSPMGMFSNVVSRVGKPSPEMICAEKE